MSNNTELLTALFSSLNSFNGLVSLSNFNLTFDDMITMAAYIMTPETKLHSLYLDCNNTNIDEKGGEKLCIALVSSPYCKLIVLSLFNTGIGINNIALLGEYLLSPSSSSLLKLCLREKRIIEAEKLFVALSSSRHCKLEELYLDGIETRSSFKHLIEYLHSPSSYFLSELSLINYNIGDIEVKILSSVLENHSYLTSLYLYGCTIGDIGVNAIRTLISNYKSSLSSIYISNSDINQIFQERVIKIAKNNKRYNKICDIIDPRRYSSADYGVVLSTLISDSESKEIIRYIQKSFRFGQSNGKRIRGSNYDMICKLISKVEESYLYQIDSKKIGILNLSVDVFKWRISFLLSIINNNNNQGIQY